MALSVGCTGSVRDDRPGGGDGSVADPDGGGVRDGGSERDGATGSDGGPTGTDGGGGRIDAGPGTCPAPPGGVSDDARAAIGRENEVRLAMGVPCATMIVEINAAAQNHCDYYEANRGNASCVGNPHAEVAGCTGFTGASFADRMRAAGYTGAPAMEDMHFIGDGAGAVQGWIDSVWHRTPVLSPWIRHVGYGATSGCDTMDFGSGDPTPATTVAVYPYPGQTGVPTSFDGRREGPMPPTPDTGWPSGYPITVYLRGDVTEHVLTVDGSDTPIDHLWIGRGSSLSMGLLRNEHVMYANDPLASGATYRVRIVGSNADGPVELDWTFTTL